MDEPRSLFSYSVVKQSTGNKNALRRLRAGAAFTLIELPRC